MIDIELASEEDALVRAVHVRLKEAAEISDTVQDPERVSGAFDSWTSVVMQIGPNLAIGVVGSLIAAAIWEAMRGRSGRSVELSARNGEKEVNLSINGGTQAEIGRLVEKALHGLDLT